MLKEIWTYGYNAWVMGGDTHYILMCEVECSDPIDLGKGYRGHIVFFPSWIPGICVIESETGAIIGDSIPEVIEDIKAGDDEVMKRQIEKSKLDLKNMRIQRVTEEEFWSRMANRKHE
jgi:hypothetical protein